MSADSKQQSKTILVGTRKSKLAIAQTELVVGLLRQAWPTYSFHVQPSDSAAGDVDKVTSFKDMPVKNLWTHDLEQSMLAGHLDILVHSLKDVPTQLPPNCVIGAIVERESPHDAFVLKHGRERCKLEDLPPGATVGTSSIRRGAQIAYKYPHLRLQDIRGNVPTRLRKLDEEAGPFDALILAAAGLKRLDLADRITELLRSSSGSMLYAVGQGAIGIECRADDKGIAPLLQAVNHTRTSLACLAERSLLRKLEGGCSAPLGVETHWMSQNDNTALLQILALIVSEDGSSHVEVKLQNEVNNAEAAERFGIAAANELLAHGAGEILEAIKAKRPTESIDLGD